MIPVQEVTLKTKEDCRFQIFIEKPADGIFTFWLHCFDPKSNFSAGHTPKTIHKSPEAAFEEMLDFVLNYIAQRKDGDSIEYIDNPCNCELINKSNQISIVSKLQQSFPVKVNGQS